MNPAKKVNAKLEQFKEEITALEAKYQYQMQAIIIYTQGGILPRLSVVDVIPPKEEPVTTDPATAPAAEPAPVEPPTEESKNIEPKK